MPRVYRKTKIRLGADRSCGRCGRAIKPGDEYLQWSFRYGGTHYRCASHYPRQSELTQSKLASVYAAQESVQDQMPELTDPDSIVAAVEDVGSAAQEVADEYREADEAFGGQGATEAAERADELEAWAQDLESFQLDVDDEEDEDWDLEAAREQALAAIEECPL